MSSWYARCTKFRVRRAARRGSRSRARRPARLPGAVDPDRAQAGRQRAVDVAGEAVADHHRPLRRRRAAPARGGTPSRPACRCQARRRRRPRRSDPRARSRRASRAAGMSPPLVTSAIGRPAAVQRRAGVGERLVPRAALDSEPLAELPGERGSSTPWSASARRPRLTPVLGRPARAARGVLVALEAAPQPSHELMPIRRQYGSVGPPPQRAGVRAGVDGKPRDVDLARHASAAVASNAATAAAPRAPASRRGRRARRRHARTIEMRAVPRPAQRPAHQGRPERRGLRRRAGRRPSRVLALTPHPGRRARDRRPRRSRHRRRVRRASPSSLAPLPMPVHVLPGNHDDLDWPARTPSTAAARCVVALRHPQPGRDDGRLDVDWLAAELARATRRRSSRCTTRRS